jgi:hypothetical protein
MLVLSNIALFRTVHFCLISTTVHYDMNDKSNTTGATSGAVTAYPSGESEFTPGI